MLRKTIILLAFLLLPFIAQAGDKLSLAIEPASSNFSVVINKSRVDWRTWEFEALGAPELASYLWDFGDRQLGEGRQIKHQYTTPGTYKITLSASDGTGAASQTEAAIVVGFWHLNNLYVRIILGILGFGIIALAIAIAFNLFPKYEEE